MADVMAAGMRAPFVLEYRFFIYLSFFTVLIWVFTNLNILNFSILMFLCSILISINKLIIIFPEKKIIFKVGIIHNLLTYYFSFTAKEARNNI